MDTAVRNGRPADSEAADRRFVPSRASDWRRMKRGGARARGADRPERSLSVTVRGAALLGAAIAALSAAYIAGLPELLILALFCAIPPVLGLLIVVRRKPRFRLVRFTSPAIVSAGAPGTARLHVANASRVRQGALQWSDDLPWSPGSTAWSEIGASDADAGFTLHYNFVAPRRGVWELGPLVVRVVDPFSLARGEFAVGGTHRVIVAPETLDFGQSLAELASNSGSARLFQHRALAGDHDIMTRDYRPGDAIRRVHWKASAHHGELMVREDEKRSHAEALILVDTRRGNWRDISRVVSPERPESERFEWTLSMVSSLRSYLIRNGLRVRVAETAVRQLADVDHADSFIESLARVRLSYQNGPALRLTEPSAASTESVFTVLDAPDPDTVAALVEQRAGFGFALAFLLGPPRADLEQQLANAGWRVHRVGEGESVLDAWHSAAGQDAAGFTGDSHGEADSDE